MKIFYNADIYGTKADAFVVDDDKFVYIGEKDEALKYEGELTDLRGKAVYPGSFDPITNGHLDIIKRAAKMFDELHILVSYNIDKKSMYNIADRIEMIKRSTKNLKNVVI